MSQGFVEWAFDGMPKVFERRHLLWREPFEAGLDQKPWRDSLTLPEKKQREIQRHRMLHREAFATDRRQSEAHGQNFLRVRAKLSPGRQW